MIGSERKRRDVDRGPGAGAWTRAYVLPGFFALLALVVLVPNLLALEEDALYPVRADSAKYHETASGLAVFVQELPSAVAKLASGGVTPEDRARWGWETGILQHATSYVTLLGAVYASFGSDPRVGRSVTVVLVALSAFLLVSWVQGRFGRPAAGLSGLLFVLWPSHVYFGTAIMTEMAMVFFFWVAITALDRTRTGPAGAVALGGAAVGWLVLAKFSLKFLAVPLLVVDLLARWREPGAVRFLAWRLVGVLLVLSLWGGFLRAAGLSGDPLASEGEAELWLFRGSYTPDRGFESIGLGDVTSPVLLDAVRSVGDVPDEAKQKAIYREAFRRAIRSDPGRWIALVAAKAGWFWRYPAVKEDVRTWFGSLPPPARLQPVTVLLALLGVGVALTRRGDLFLPLLVALYLTAVHAGTHLVSRYNVPAFGALLAFAGWGAVWLVAAARALATRARSGPPAGPPRKKPPRSRRPSRLGSLVAFARPRGALGGAALGAAVIAALVLGLGGLAGRDVWVGWGMQPRTGYYVHHLLVLAGFVLAGAAAFLGVRAAGGAVWRAAAVALLPLGLGLSLFGEAHANRDPDGWSAKLERPGDTIVQELRLPRDVEWRAVEEAEVLIDLLPDLGAELRLSVRIDGEEVRRFDGRITNPDEDYQVDPRIHAVQERYDRLRRAYQTLSEGFVERRHPGTGFTYFPQWYRIPVPLERIEGREAVRIEIVLESARGGGVRVFGDAAVSPYEDGLRVILAPAFLENPYELSSYQLQLFATARDRAEARFVRPQKLHSLEARSAFVRGGRVLGRDLSPAPGMQVGEYRVRLRTRLRGFYVYRDGDGDGSPRPIWAVWPEPEERPLPADDLRVFSSRRDAYFDGWRTY